MKIDVSEMDTAVSGGVYIETYGCQMNLVDSEIVLSMLEEQGYRRVEQPEQAEVILINTCAIRDHAVVKAISNVGRFKRLKQARPETRIGVIGCMSKYAADDIARQVPFVSWILGPDLYRRLPQLLQEEDNKSPLILRDGDSKELYDEILPARREGINAWVTITRGCNNHCTYCVVPGARGPERHRPAESILSEIQEAVSQGFVQITLLGQNVNSYSHDSIDFADLLRMAADVEGVGRMRFMTSHPKDCSEKLLDTIASHSRICPELHLPFQAGSDRILKRMNRKYTSDHYLNLIKLAKEKIENLYLSTDIIVGFPGETEEEFLQTEEIVKKVQYDSAFIYKYSERVNTPAAKLEDDIPEDEKVKRLMRLNEIVRESGIRSREKQIGRILPVMIEGPSVKDPEESLGRSPAGYNIVIAGRYEPGTIVDTKIEKLSGLTLRGIENN